MALREVKVAVADIILLFVAYFVLQDIQGRVAYAASPHANVGGYVPSFSYGILTRTFTMSGGSFPLVSPPALDWLQVVAIALAVVNVPFLYAKLKGSGS